MTEVPEQARHWLDRPGMVVVGHVPMVVALRAVYKSAPTMLHAARLFDAVVDRLGDRGFVDPSFATMGCERRLYLRDADRVGWIVGTPIVEHRFVNRIIIGDDGKPIPPKPSAAGPDIVPSGPMMRAGEIILGEGAAFVSVEYNDRGLRSAGVHEGGDKFLFNWRHDSSPFAIDPLARPPTLPPHSVLCRADATEEGWPIDALADMVAATTPAIAAQIHLPAPVPGGARGVLDRAIGAMRDALFADLPSEAAWLVADGFDGTAIAWGATADEAIERWRRELFRKKPQPPKPPPEQAAPPPPPSDEPRRLEPQGPRVFKDSEGRTTGWSSGLVSIAIPPGGGGAGAAIPEPVWPAAVPDNIPGVLVPLPPLPEIEPRFRQAGFNRWLRVVGAHGDVRRVLVKQSERGLTMIGEGVLDLVDPTAIEAEIDAADADFRAWMEGSHIGRDPHDDPTAEMSLDVHDCFDNGRRKRMPCTHGGGQMGAEIGPCAFDGDTLPWRVGRLRSR